jgi:hypothetical protein
MLSPALRTALVLTALMNWAGGIAFLPFYGAGRLLVGLPDAPPFYLWILSIWVFAFGAAYLHQGLTGRADRGVLALGAVGKMSFACALVATSWGGPHAGAAVAAALPDVVLAAWFFAWLGRTARPPVRG